MQSWEDRNLYDMMQLSMNASSEQVNRQYRRLASKWHPDKNPENPHAVAKLQLLNYARATLLKPESRARYDKKLIAQQKEKQKQIDALKQAKTFSQDEVIGQRVNMELHRRKIYQKGFETERFDAGFSSTVQDASAKLRESVKVKADDFVATNWQTQGKSSSEQAISSYQKVDGKGLATNKRSFKCQA